MGFPSDGTAGEAVGRLSDFIAHSPTPYHAAEEAARILEAAGFERLSEGSRWALNDGKPFFIARGGSSLMAVIPGTLPPWETGFVIAGAHLDSPAFKVKTAAVEDSRAGSRIGVDVYGEPIISSWLDRELGIAGAVFVREGEGIVRHLVDSRRPVALVPNLAIAINRDLNRGFEYNRQFHLPAVLSAGHTGIRGSSETLQGRGFPDGDLIDWILAEAGIDRNDFLEADLFLYDTEPPRVVGYGRDLVCGPRLDNLLMCHTILEGFARAGRSAAWKIAALFNSEEIGSVAVNGASSSLLAGLLRRVIELSGGGYEDYAIAVSRSLLVSADVAHGIHPNFTDKHDPSYAPALNGGPVIKYSSSGRYATTGSSASRFMDLCGRAGVGFQKFLIRSDLSCGSTIGPGLSAQLGVETVDMGNAIWAMHSIRETTGMEDIGRAIAVFSELFR